tara:strand:+ start:1470 stop:1748 length:279 start_codon:yes stop_codon:yes gene_type:complete
MKKINISKYKGNTHYSVHITDSYGTEHHLGLYKSLSPEVLSEIEADAEMLWANEVKPKEDLMASAIANMIELEKKSGLRFTDSRGNHRDGLD